MRLRAAPVAARRFERPAPSHAPSFPTPALGQALCAGGFFCYSLSELMSCERWGGGRCDYLWNLSRQKARHNQEDHREDHGLQRG
jgi:hypothetical protein